MIMITADRITAVGEPLMPEYRNRLTADVELTTTKSTKSIEEQNETPEIGGEERVADITLITFIAFTSAGSSRY